MPNDRYYIFSNPGDQEHVFEHLSNWKTDFSSIGIIKSIDITFSALYSFTAEDNKLYENIKIREIRCKEITGISLGCYHYYLSETDHEKLIKNQTS